MAKYLHLQIPQSCHEDWNKMQPNQQGKFCLSCQKSVVDFTSMSDRQVVEYFKNYKGSTCGRFSSEQLDRDIIIPRKPFPFVKHFFQILLPAFLLSFKGIAQKGKQRQVEIVEQNMITGDTAPVEIEEPIMRKPIDVQGAIIGDDGYPVIGASVIIKGTNRGTVTDTAGKFILKEVETPLKLVVSFVGYETKEVQISKKDSDVVHISLQVRLETQMMGEVVIVGAIVPSKRKSKAEKKQICKKIEPTLSLYPNPVVGSPTLNVKWQDFEKGQYSLEIYNSQGALMQSQELNIEAWMQEYPLKLQLQVAGNYVLRLVNKKTGKRVSQHFIVN